MKNEEMFLRVVECLDEEYGWIIHSASGNEDHLQERIKDAQSEYKKDRIRTRIYRPEK